MNLYCINSLKITKNIGKIIMSNDDEFKEMHAVMNIVAENVNTFMKNI